MLVKRKGIISSDIMVYAIALLLITGMMLSTSTNSAKEGKNAQAASIAAMLGGCISEYEMEIGTYPEALTDLTKAHGQYKAMLKSIPEDPWGNAYIYKKSDDGFAVYSLGSDKVDNGSSISGIAKGDIGYFGK